MLVHLTLKHPTLDNPWEKTSDDLEIIPPALHLPAFCGAGDVKTKPFSPVLLSGPPIMGQAFLSAEGNSRRGAEPFLAMSLSTGHTRQEATDTGFGLPT